MSNIRLGYRNLLYCTLLLLASGGKAWGVEILVRMPTGQTVTVQAEPENTVGDVKEMVFDITNIHTINQLMYKGDRELDDDKTLSSCGISDKDTLTVKYGSKTTGKGKKRYGKYIAFILPLVIIAVIAYKIKKIMSDE